MLNNLLETRVDRFVKRLEREQVCMHGFILSVGDNIKASAYYAPFKEGDPHRMYSISKTMTALAIGMLIDQGKLALDHFVADYFQDYLPAQPDGRLLRLTIGDMLRMATCYRSTTYREGIDSNWTKPFFTSTPTHEPGTVFYYDTGCSQVLSSLVTRLSGQEVIDFLNTHLFDKIGANDPKYWLRDPSGQCQGGTGLCMSLRDLHKVSRLVMAGGGDVLPRWFCEEMGKCHSINLLNPTREESYGYGWQVWRTRAGWAMYGLGGQLAVVCPEKDLLLCTIADTRLDPMGVQRIYDAFFEEIYPYVGTEDMAEAQLALQTRPVAHNAAFGMTLSEVYHFSTPNPLDLLTVSLNGNALEWENARGSHRLRFGIGENVVDTFPGWPAIPTLSSGGWVAEGLLHIRCHLIGDAPCGIDMLLHFSGNCLTIQSRCSTDPATKEYDGVASGYLA